MNIGLHIAELLEEHGKVSVQGVGTFFLKKTDAYFDEDRQMFFPRDRKLSFKLFEEDSLTFSKYVSKAEDISSVAANHVIKEFAIKFNNALGTSGTAEIRGIGKLRKEGSEYIIDSFTSYGLVPLPDSGSVVFEADAPDFVKEAPGFKKDVQEEKVVVDEAPIPDEIRKEEAPAQEEEILSEPEIIAEQLPLVEEAPIPKEETPLREEYIAKEEIPTKNVTDPEEDELPEEAIREIFKGNYDGLFSNVGDIERPASEKEETEPQNSSWLKWLIVAGSVLLVAGSVLGYLFYPKIKAYVSKYRSENVAIDTTAIVPQQIVPVPVDSLLDSLVNKQTDSIIAEASKSSSSLKSDTVKSGSATYEIIVASFARKSEADSYVSQWTSKGQAVHIIERPLRTFKYKISAGSFTDQASAQSHLSEVQKNISKDAWIDLVKN